MNNLSDNQAKKTKKEKPKVCDYCGKPWDVEDQEGYVLQYKAWVHESCYEDNHG